MCFSPKGWIRLRAEMDLSRVYDHRNHNHREAQEFRLYRMYLRIKKYSLVYKLWHF